jgi:hypothetical protein
MIVRDFGPDDIDDDEDWGEDPDEETTMPCPRCREPVYDDAERCPYCGSYLTGEDAPDRKPWWLLVGVVASLSMVAWWIFHP